MNNLKPVFFYYGILSIAEDEYKGECTICHIDEYAESLLC